MFLVVLTLLWWRARLDGVEATSLLSWKESVNDVIWVFSCLEDSYANGSDERKTVETGTRGKKRK
jgi:hypothetical protein